MRSLMCMMKVVCAVWWMYEVSVQRSQSPGTSHPDAA